MKKSLIIFSSLVLLGGLWWLVRYYWQFGVASPLQPGKPVIVSSELPGSTGGLTSTNSAGVATSGSYTVEQFVANLRVPWSIVFTSPTRLLVTERPGGVRVVEQGQLLSEPIRVFTEVSSDSEEGLMGMTLDPDYAKNKFVYVCVAYEVNGVTFDKVVRVTDHDKKLDQDLVIIDHIPAAKFHAGCRVRFGPDAKLYISTGDATDKKLPQDVASLGGKLLRINADGSVPTDNPFANSPIFSFGHRNPQGFDWHPITQMLIETEHGPSGNDGPGGGDEVNIIKKGQNYGWPIVSHLKSQPGMIDPLLVFTPAEAPASGMFYKGKVLPQFTNTFLFGLLRGEGIMQVVFDQKNPEKVVSYQKLPGITVGRVRDVVEGPDGYIYFTTSNQDGRGKPQIDDDKIYRLVPASIF